MQGNLNCKPIVHASRYAVSNTRPITRHDSPREAAGHRTCPKSRAHKRNGLACDEKIKPCGGGRAAALEPKRCHSRPTLCTIGERRSGYSTEDRNLRNSPLDPG